MTTTAIFAELLVSGIETLTWVVFLTCVISNKRFDVSTLLPLKDWSALVTILIVAAAYALGTISDRLADGIFGIWDKRLRRQRFENDDEVGLTRLRIAKTSESLARYLEYIRSRLRVARATSFNAACFCLVALVACITHYLSGPAVTVLTILSFVVAALAAYSWHDSSAMFYRRLAQAGTLVDEPPAEVSQ